MRIPILNIPIVGKHTVLSSDDTRHKVALLIGIGHALFVDDTLRRSREVAPNGIETILYLSDFLKGNRCACITFDTALSLADTEVATKLLRQNLRRE